MGWQSHEFKVGDKVAICRTGWSNQVIEGFSVVKTVGKLKITLENGQAFKSNGHQWGVGNYNGSYIEPETQEHHDRIARAKLVTEFKNVRDRIGGLKTEGWTDEGLKKMIAAMQTVMNMEGKY
jgi:hypothetical protein